MHKIFELSVGDPSIQVLTRVHFRTRTRPVFDGNVSGLGSSNNFCVFLNGFSHETLIRHLKYNPLSISRDFVLLILKIPNMKISNYQYKTNR